LDFSLFFFLNFGTVCEEEVEKSNHCVKVNHLKREESGWVNFFLMFSSFCLHVGTVCEKEGEKSYVVAKETTSDREESFLDLK
jgi:hypothetical protein